MKKSDKFYLENHYPLQDGILTLLKELNLPFYLTGGTALSRFYFNHRYSDDLDLFVNDDKQFNRYCKLFFDSLITQQYRFDFKLDRSRITKTENYMQFFLQKENYELKIDLVNDVAPHFGEFIYSDKNFKIDSLRNILSNKLSALYRFEPKDVVDIWFICKNYKFNFNEIIREAKLKDASVDPITIYEILSTFPINKLDLIKWVAEIDYKIFEKELKLIAEDIFYGRENRLYN